jgi:outer membrane murein-binding lipoprotein Lpp
VITSAFVARAQAAGREEREDQLVTKLDQISSEVEALRSEVSRLSP